MSDPRRRIPRTDVVLADPEFVWAAERLGRQAVKRVVAAAQDRARRGEIAPGEVAAAASAALPATASALRPVINASGVLVHTNLGRAPLSRDAVDAVVAAAGCTDVEFDLDTGTRARRGSAALAALADAVPDAADVHVVNNNAAALLLAASALAPGKEIVVSRGELVEIGDGFRIPDLLTSTGAVLHEVGTTNRTTLADYAGALGERTGFLLKVHPSNFRVSGFTAAASIAQLASLGPPVLADVGSGLLAPDASLPEEPDVTTALRAGADLVTASGDKLLGGPQCGLVVGSADLVAAVRRHPAARAVRVDKLTLAALEAVLRAPAPPVARALHAAPEELRARARVIAGALARAGVDAYVVDCVSAVGGGGAPGVSVPSAAVSVPAGLARALRLGRPAVVGRTERGRCLLDLRTVEPEDGGQVTDAVLAAAGRVRDADGPSREGGARCT